MIDMRGMKRSMKLAEWARLIEQRVESGKTINAWCEEQGIPRRHYYYWQNQVREEMVSNVALSYTCVPGIVPVDNSSSASAMILPDTPSFAKIPLNSILHTEAGAPATLQTCIGAPVMKILLGRAECEIYNGADIDLVERVLIALGKI